MTVEFEAAAAICNMPALLSGQLTPSKLLLFELLVHYPHHLDKVMSSLPTLLQCTQREPVAHVLNTVAYFHATGAAGTIPAGVLDRFARTVFSFLA